MSRSKDEPDDAAADGVKVDGWKESRKAIKRDFPAADAGDVPFRVAMDRDAFAEVTAHAREQLDCEICGVLAGELCRDGDGEYVHVRAAVRGRSVRQGSAHVTFTQETWTTIHEEMDAKHKKLQIVGWYHSHPGFGVTFSDMDKFIQTNFFGAPHQIALVTDPLGGETAICVTRDGGIEYLPRFWVEGRAQTCTTPAAAKAPASASGDSAGGGLVIGAADLEAQFAALDMRLSQVTQALDDTRNDFYRLLLFTFMLVCCTIIGFIGWTVYKNYTDTGEPPKPLQYFTEVVKVGDHNVRLSLAVLGWDIPDEISLKSIERDKIRREVLENLYRQIKEHPESLVDSLAPPAPAAPQLAPTPSKPTAEPEPFIPMRRPE